MDFLEPRRTYQRANTDDHHALGPDPYSVELSSLRTKSSFNSGFTNTIRDQSPLLDHSLDPIRAEPTFGEKRSKVAFFTWPARFHGWRTGALWAAALATLSFLINLVVVIWLGSNNPGSGLVEVYNGDCGKVQSLDIWVHLAINALSTLLLGGSNYCMQCLCAPTRSDVDRAHAKGKFLDIGVPSVRNLRNVPLYKTLMWWMLGLSSVPLHLMYNSAFYKSLSTNDYDYYFVTQDFVDGGAIGNETDAYAAAYGPVVDPAELQDRLLTSPEQFDRLDTARCITAYATNFLSNRRNLILVSSNGTSKTNSSLLYVRGYEFSDDRPFDWICNSDQSIRRKAGLSSDTAGKPCETYVSDIVAITDQWIPYGWGVEYCLSERVEERCSYSGNIPIVAVVVVCNALKIVGMLFVAFRLRDRPLITIGDAVESFLNESDDTTKGLCLLTRKEVVKAARKRGHWRVDKDNGGLYPPPPQVANPRIIHWSKSASTLRWTMTIGFILFALIVVGSLLAFAVATIRADGFTVFDLGFGKVVPTAIITGWDIGYQMGATQSILASILIANLPQTILSFLYLHLNGLLTTMWLASEWGDFAHERKTLRVSRPRGAQRSTHFLQLPYKIALPLMVLSGVLHWLISQSIFLAVVAEYSPSGKLSSPVAIASCGFSPLAMIMVMVAGGCIVVVTVGLGRRKYDETIPLVGSCSAAIAAACHQPGWDADASLKPVMWGVIPEARDGDGTGVGHCAFTSGEVGRLESGREYAGFGLTRKAWMR